MRHRAWNSAVCARLWLLPLLLLLVALVSAGPVQQTDVARASQLFSQGKYAEVVAFCGEALLKDPKNTALLNTRGAAKHMLADYLGALGDYDQAIAYGDKTDVIHGNRGRTLRQLGRLEESIAAFSQAIAIDRTVGTHFFERGYSKYRLRRFKDALVDAEEAIRLNKNASSHMSLRGLIYMDLGENALAEKDFDAAIKLAPSYGQFYADRATVRRRQNKTKEALDDADRAIKLGYNGANGYNARGLVRTQAKDFKGAIEDFELALTKAPKNATIQANLGRCYYNMGQTERALEEYAKALVLDPKSSTALRYRSELYEAKGDLDKARADALDAVLSEPTSPSARDLAKRLVPSAIEIIDQEALASSAATSFGQPAVMTGVLISKDWKEPANDPSVNVLWKPRTPLPVTPPKVIPIPVPSPLEFTNLSMSSYNWAVTTAKEGMRVVMGPMTPAQELQYENKWAPYYDAPTPEVLNYLNKLSPLLARFIEARSGYTQAAQEVGKALFEAAVLSEAGKNEESAVAMDAARQYKVWADGYESSMRQIIVEIDALGPMPNPYEARRRRAKRVEDEVKRLAPKSATTPTRLTDGEYFVLDKLDKFIPQHEDPKVKFSGAEGFVTMSSAGKMWYVEKGTISMTVTGQWTPFPRIIRAYDNKQPPMITLTATANISFAGVEEAAITGFELRTKLGTVVHMGTGQTPLDGDSFGSVRATASRNTDTTTIELLKSLHMVKMQNADQTTTATMFVTVQTNAGNAVFQYRYRLIPLKASQAEDIEERAKKELAELGKEQKTAEKQGEENAAKVAQMQFLIQSREFFAAERQRVAAELQNAPASSQKELTMRFLYADAQAQAATDEIQYATTGQWARTRTLYDDYDFHRMIEIGREESARLNLPLKAVKAAEAQIQLAPEHMRAGLRDKLQKGLTSEMMRGLDSSGVRKLASEIGDQVQDYWVKQAGRETFKANIAYYAEETTKLAAGVVICGAGTVYVAGLGITGVALWGADTLIGAAYGGVSGYVEGGPDEACRKSLEWAGLLGFTASSAISAYGEGEGSTGAISAAARSVLLAKAFQYAGSYIGSFFGKPSVQEQFAMAKFKQEMEWGQALIQRSQRAEAAAANAASKGITGPAMQQIERELSEATAAVNGSWHAKVLLKYGADEAAGQAFIKRIEKLYGEVQPDFVLNLKAMGYDTTNLRFEPVRNATSSGTVGIDLDLKLIESPGMMLKKNGQSVSLATFNNDAQKAYNRAYFTHTGYSAEQSLINITTTAHREAFTQRMIQKGIPFENLTGFDRQRAGEVLIMKTSGVPLDGFTKAAEASRAMEKELRLRLIPDLKAQAALAAKAKDAAQLKRLNDSIQFWEDIRTRTEVMGQGETDPHRLWKAMQELKGLTGGQDVFDLAKTLSAYWPSLAAWK